MGDGDGTTPPEQYVAYHSDPLDPSLIMPGDTCIFKNVQTGLYCRLAPYPAGGSNTCLTEGVLCDKSKVEDATVITYTGTGLSYNGVPLVQTPITNTLVLSSDPTCKVPSGELIYFPPGGEAGCRSGLSGAASSG